MRSCALSVQNISDTELTECLVDIEQLSGLHPPGMPLPLVLHTEGQIRGNRSGSFKLRPGSPGQKKSVPILFRSLNRKNEWHFLDENGNSYFTPVRDLKFVLAIHCEKGTDRVLVKFFLGERFDVYSKLEIVAPDFELRIN